MAQLSTELVGYAPTQRLLRKQRMGAKSVAVQKKFVKKWFIYLLVALVAALFYVWSRVSMIQYGYNVSDVQSKVIELKKQVQSLEMEIARMKSPANLEVIAKEKLGMHQASADQMVWVRPESK